ncbi:hypothetical protein B6V73_00410 [Thioclava sp. JM3]|nr:hypothetical protein B6V73_00410 [Thioclava sp. JM3]
MISSHIGGPAFPRRGAAALSAVNSEALAGRAWSYAQIAEPRTGALATPRLTPDNGACSALGHHLAFAEGSV